MPGVSAGLAEEMMFGFFDISALRDLLLGGGLVRLVASAGGFHPFEARPQMQRNGATGNLYRLHRCVSLDESSHQNPQNIDECVLFIGLRCS